MSAALHSLACLATLIVACSSPAAPGDDAAPPDAAAEAETEAGADVIAPSDDGVRVANMREDGVAIDACIAAGADAFGAPRFSSEGLASGVLPQHVSAYVPLTPGSYRVRLVAPGSDCATPLAPDVPLTVATGAYQTLLAISGTDAGATSALFEDEHDATAKIHVRLLNASVEVDSPTLKIGTTLVYDDAPLAALPVGAPDAGVDPRGYLDSDPMPVMNGPDGLPLWLRASGWATPVRVRVMPLADGDVVSLFVFGAPAGLGSLNATQTVIACKDLVTQSGETSCAPYVN